MSQSTSCGTAFDLLEQSSLDPFDDLIFCLLIPLLRFPSKFAEVTGDLDGMGRLKVLKYS